ncbi:hypothetical protein HPB50_021605 [Hyalomma asiaticum]|uniref:Uncharacterized protein n=1 Tax=Hyalomma asiaticum TaxID=266040 RepID=A0ACB7T101_HYAAI|nr:hypothetical protein HPB50_021605 [Hyalomma asiaticum]
MARRHCWEITDTKMRRWCSGDHGPAEIADCGAAGPEEGWPLFFGRWCPASSLRGGGPSETCTGQELFLDPLGRPVQCP